MSGAGVGGAPDMRTMEIAIELRFLLSAYCEV